MDQAVVVVPAARLEHVLAAALPQLRPPVPLVHRLEGELGGERVLLAAGDLRPLGFGAHDGQLCLVTPTRVLLATGLGTGGPEAFAVEVFDRQAAPVPRLVPGTRPVAPRRSPED